MTDNEIIKALECCLLSNEQQCEQCEKCPLDETFEMICQNLLAYHALDLINRQKAEIEWLKQIQSDNEKAFNKMTELYNKAFNRCKTAKAEAIKECLSWVLSLFPEDKNFTTISRFTVKQKLKEMGLEQ